ncbi:TIR domain-containing protein [Rhizobium leguminosarum]|uniref:toll/interleukin-1 receptor domain-containing protein n=1 Tax=Rhizobium leguminosarum TaxID=384 RepID=UPI001C957368|nr:toll/interleukin-1 receptor domain-containing protein [Rhizobium leguminosarum]MBY5685010.1 TIR domain-containing protein [Rhizobium leguminosarum]
MAYQWDIFLSYPRTQYVQPWVDNHFLPLLHDHLDALLPNEPRIFVDRAQPVGVDWPDNIKSALKHSRVMVAVWTPPYFRSHWCIAEWESMLAREQRFTVPGTVNQARLVYPVKYSDGRNFDERAKSTLVKDLSSFGYHLPNFREAIAYIDFYNAVRDIAEDIEMRLAAAPDWHPDFPLIDVEPIVQTGPRVRLPRI